MSKIFAGCAIKCNRILSILHAGGCNSSSHKRIISFACSQLDDRRVPFARLEFLSAAAPISLCCVSLRSVVGRDHHNQYALCV